MLLDNDLMRWAMDTRPYYRLTMRRIQKVTSVIDAPVSVQIETTNSCNARCVMCPNPQHMRPRGHMDAVLFERIVDDLSTVPSVRELSLSGFGEPFLDRQLIDRIKYVKRRTDKSTIVYSNFSIVSEEKMNDLLDSGLDTINVSFNGATKESYESTMKLPFERTLANINRFIEIKTARAATKPRIVLSCVLTPFNEDEGQRLHEMWAGKVDDLYFAPPDNWVGAVTLRLKSHERANRPAGFAYPCKLYWPTINWNGDIGFCCRDYEGREVFGNMHTDRFMEVWMSPRFVEHRRTHYAGKMASVCAACDVPYRRADRKWWDPV